MKKQNAMGWRALVSSAALGTALPAAIVGAGALGCDTVRSTSSSTNWLMCRADADCARFSDATCNDDLICVDASGDPIPANTSQNGLVANGGNGAEDGCDDATQATPCLNAGGTEAGGTTSGGSGGATLDSGGTATVPVNGAAGSGGAAAGGTTSSAGSGGVSAGGTSGGGTSGGGTSGGGASSAGAGGGSGAACDCAAGGYCERSSCDLDAPGECAAMPQVCPANYAPVCGCNGVTYSNGCGAASAGINLDTTGAACEDPGVVLTIVVDDGTFGPLVEWFNGTEESIFLRGCSTVDAWYRQGDEWIEYGALANCAVETAIVEVMPGTGRTESVPTAPERGDDVWRFVGPYGVGCTPGSLFSNGECDETFEVTSYNQTDWNR